MRDTIRRITWLYIFIYKLFWLIFKGLSLGLVPESLTPNQIDLIIFGDALGALIYVKDARITE